MTGDSTQDVSITDAGEGSSQKVKASAWQLMSTFALVGLCAFGGVMPWVYRAIVDKRKWLDDREFAELWGQALVIPGATSTNVAATLGYRLAGVRGAIAAVIGLLGPPAVIVVIMAYLYRHFGMVLAVKGAVRGITAVAAGLVLATGVRLAIAQPRKLSLPVFASAAVIGVTVLQWPLVLVIGVLLPLSFAVEWKAKK